MSAFRLYKKKIFTLGIASLALIGVAFKTDLFQVSKNLDIFAAVYKELNINYVEDVNSAELIKTGIDAMLNRLDPYTEFVPESDIEDYKMKYVSTQYGGIGAGIIHRDGKVFISDPFEGYPAQKADLRAGDEIISINGQNLYGKSNEEVSLLLKGPKATDLVLKIGRNGQEIEKTLQRAEIKQPNVSYYGVLPNQMAYIKLDKFLENAAAEVKSALLEMEKKNPRGLVLDLRNNGGGILQEAVKIVNLFVDKDVEVVAQKGKNPEKNIQYKTFLPAEDAQIPLIVLINGRSASASEIVAGSLQDLDRAIIIGQRSFGKGLVQQTFNLPYNTLVKVTVAKYYTPSGRCIQALDYTHRLEDGSVEKVSDSLITEFKTKGGRSVYDGSGIYPDIFLEPFKYHDITQTLVAKFHVFDFATQYVRQHPGIASAESFQLNDAGYSEFLTFLNGKDFKYQSATESLFATLQEEAHKDKNYESIQSELEALEKKIYATKRSDLQTFKPEIKRVLEAEIVQRYYFEKGRIQQSFQYDEELKKAAEIINSNTQMIAVLSGEGTFKTIGKPGEITARAE